MFDSTHFHPMMVHYPIAIITVGFFADLLSLVLKKEKWLSNMGYWLEVIGMISAIIAFGTGYFFTAPMEGEAGVMREKHEFFATITLITIILATLFRIIMNYQEKEGTSLKYVSLTLFLLAFIFVSITGFLGGSLVLNYMIGL